ncbi:MAG: hypothetical protein WCO55_05570 [Candidatus Falkowbacteria bacterium]
MEPLKTEQLPRIETPLRGAETAAEKKTEAQPQTEARPARPAEAPVAPAAISAPPAAAYKDPRLTEIESVLEEDLGEIYFSMSPEQQVVFKQTGEVAAQQINDLLSGFKVQAKKIADLIRAWLGLLPGINKFFLEQETKIKTDKLINRFRP